MTDAPGGAAVLIMPQTRREMSTARAAAQLQPHRRFRWDGRGLAHIYLYIAIWLLVFTLVPNTLNRPGAAAVILLVGVLGVWRYSWWMINLIRSQLYGHVYFPRIRAHADAAWSRGWRPRHIHFLMTTFHERVPTTHAHLDAILRELRRENVAATLWVGYGAPEDAAVIRDWREAQTGPTPLEIVLVRQNQPGKRMAIGVILRALARRGAHGDDIAYLLDGDSILGEGALQKTLSLFAADPELAALTTDEDAVVSGPAWVQEWLDMRFAQRRMWMQSHALSQRVLTLTGRMSAFRASWVVEKEFIRTVEADELSHWLWGNFRFLSGDDKSTWYHLLQRRAKMLYAPDAIVYTIEHIEGRGFKRMRDNLLRWSGNMLRNGMRAIMLGPRVATPFIWWCLVDQRLSIWTILAGFTAAMTITLFVTPWFFFTYLLWITMTRFVLATSLFLYTDRIRIAFPFLLYANQLASAALKAYVMFHLPRQRWTNRKGQKGGEDVMNNPFRRAMAGYINTLYVCAMCFLVLLLTGILAWPDAYQLLPPL